MVEPAARVKLRLFVESDLPSIFEIHRVDEVNRYLPYLTWTSLDDGAVWLERVQQRASAGGEQFVICLTTEPEQIIGTCLLFNLSEENGTADIGYCMGHSFQGQGYGGEAVSALIDHAFQTRGLRRLEANVDVRNIASHQLLLRLGFTYEGMRREQKVCKGELIDLNVYGLLAREW